MQTATIDPALAGILAKATGRPRDQLRPQTRLDQLGLDSLARIDLAVAAEDLFGVAIPDDDLDRFATIGDLADFLQHAKA